MAASTEVTAETLTLLEERLQRVDYALNGYDSSAAEPSNLRSSAPVTTRLRHLERALQSLASDHEAVANTLALQKASPSIFHPGTQADAASTLPINSLTALILSHASLYSSVSTNLSSIQTISIPDPSSAAALTKLQPRIEHLAAKQEQQAREVAELRARSARAVEQWYNGGVLDMGESWADWEERVRDAEILVRRKEAAQKREAEGLI